MGSTEDHIEKFAHIWEDLRRNQKVTPAASSIQDLFFCACHLVDSYLALYDTHPRDREHRTWTLSVLSEWIPGLKPVWEEYRPLAGAFAVTGTKPFSPAEIGSFTVSLRVLDHWVSQVVNTLHPV